MNFKMAYAATHYLVRKKSHLLRFELQVFVAQMCYNNSTKKVARVLLRTLTTPCLKDIKTKFWL